VNGGSSDPELTPTPLTRPAGQRDTRLVFALTALGVFAAAQVVGYLVHTRLPLHESYVVNDFLYLTHVRNTGGVFGMFPGNSVVFAITSTLTVVVLCAMALRHEVADVFHRVCFGLIVGAAASNIFDRLVYGAVIDYLDVQGIPYWSYVFNLADCAIHVGAWPLAIVSLFPSLGRKVAKAPQ
jgi:signal peptidase II